MPSRPATECIVTVNGAPDPTLRALEVHRSTGSGSRDYATIEVDLSTKGTAQEWIQNFAMVGQSGAPIQVTAFPGGVPQLIHSGAAVLPRIKIDSDSERLTFVSRVEPWMFGVVMDGIFSFDPVSSNIVTILDECIFNRRIDDQVLGNQSGVPRLLGLAPVFLDQESCRTPEAIAVQGDFPQFWTLQSAVAYLCWALNPDQAWIANPLSFDLLPSWPLQDCKLERGKFLCDYLDELLPRFGLGWYLDYSLGAPQITFIVRGMGTLNTVYLGPPGNSYSGDNAIDTTLDYDAGNTVNRVVCYGDWYYSEATFVLSRAWDDALDALPEAQLSKDSTQFQTLGDDYRATWRKWALNEAGDYVGLRPEITAPYDLSAIFLTATVPRRRAFLPTITLDQDLAPYGQTAGITVEYSTDGGATWNPISRLEDRTCVVLERECGVYFDGLFPPAELRRAGANAKVRVTATVRSDLRLGTIVGPDESSPLQAPSPVLIDASKNFHWRQVDPSSIYFEAVAGGTLSSAACFDFDALQSYAEWLQQTFDVADASGQLVVEGLDTVGAGGVYDLGQVITGVLGRDVSFNVQRVLSGENRFPQVVAISYDCQAQRRTLSLETFRDSANTARAWVQREVFDREPRK